MTRLFFALILLIVTIAQATVIPAVNVLDVGPNLALVLILVWSAHKGVPEGVIWAFLLGIVLDVLTLAPLGSNALALIPVALIGGLSRQRLLHSGVIVPMLLVVLATLIYQLVGSVVLAAQGMGYSVMMSVRLGILTALLNMMMVPPIYLAVEFVDRLGVGRAARA